MMDYIQLNSATFLSVCLILLILIGISLILGHLTGPQGVPPKTIENAENLLSPNIDWSPAKFRAMLTITDGRFRSINANCK